MRVHHALHVDLSDAFDGADEVGVLAQQIAWTRGFDVLFGIAGASAMFLQQADFGAWEN